MTNRESGGLAPFRLWHVCYVGTRWHQERADSVLHWTGGCRSGLTEARCWLWCSMRWVEVSSVFAICPKTDSQDDGTSKTELSTHSEPMVRCYWRGRGPRQVTGVCRLYTAEWRMALSTGMVTSRGWGQTTRKPLGDGIGRRTGPDFIREKPHRHHGWLSPCSSVPILSAIPDGFQRRSQISTGAIPSMQSR